MFNLILAIVLILLLVGFFPFWPYNARRTWGWWPSSIFAILLIIFIVAVLFEVL